jgi:hypothetical protein
MFEGRKDVRKKWQIGLLETLGASAPLLKPCTPLAFLPSTSRNKIILVDYFPAQMVLSRLFSSEMSGPALSGATVSHWPARDPISFTPFLIPVPSFSRDAYSYILKMKAGSYSETLV